MGARKSAKRPGPKRGPIFSLLGVEPLAGLLVGAGEATGRTSECLLTDSFSYFWVYLRARFWVLYHLPITR